MLGMTGIAVDEDPKPDWTQIVERLLADEYQKISELEEHFRAEISRDLRDSIGERMLLLKKKMRRKRARLLASMHKMDDVMHRLDAARTLSMIADSSCGSI